MCECRELHARWCRRVKSCRKRVLALAETGIVSTVKAGYNGGGKSFKSILLKSEFSYNKCGSYQSRHGVSSNSPLTSSCYITYRATLQLQPTTSARSPISISSYPLFYLLLLCIPSNRAIEMEKWPDSETSLQTMSSHYPICSSGSCTDRHLG